MKCSPCKSVWTELEWDRCHQHWSDSGSILACSTMFTTVVVLHPLWCIWQHCLEMTNGPKCWHLVSVCEVWGYFSYLSFLWWCVTIGMVADGGAGNSQKASQILRCELFFLVHSVELMIFVSQHNDASKSGHHFADHILRYAFLKGNCCVLIKFLLHFVIWIQQTVSLHWFM